MALQGEIWIFDGAVTAVNDNAAFLLSDADAAKLVGIVPFWLGRGAGANATDFARAELAFTAVGSADPAFLVKVNNAYAPAALEELRFRFKIERW